MESIVGTRLIHINSQDFVKTGGTIILGDCGLATARSIIIALMKSGWSSMGVEWASNTQQTNQKKRERKKGERRKGEEKIKKNGERQRSIFALKSCGVPC